MKPRYKTDLSRQQADCEANYQRLLRLMPGLHKRKRWQYLVGNDNNNDNRVVIKVTERARYTTTIHLLECCRSLSIYEDNSINVRIYHDANLAEVVGWRHYSGFQARYNYPNLHMHQCDERERLNNFLGELLNHCLLHGRVAKIVLPATVIG